MPSAVSEPLWALHVCDNKCSEQGFKYFQQAAVVTEEGGAVHTINLCKQCYNEWRVEQGEQPVKAAKWREMMGEKAYRGKLWKVFGMEQFVRGMWEHFTVKRTWVMAVLADAEKEKHAYKVGNQSRPSKKYWSKSENQVSVKATKKHTGTKVKFVNGHSSK